MVVPNTLVSGASLRRGENLISSDQHYTLLHQYDGNVVLYDNDSQKALWSTDTYGRTTTSFIMQEDNNLVLYEKGGKPIWASDTWHSGGNKVVMQNDGNFVIYDDKGSPKWATDTYRGIKPRSEISMNEELQAGQELTSPNRNNLLRFQKDGNVVLLKGGKKVWETGTAGSKANALVMQIDGNLALYDNSAGAAWASGSYGSGGRNAVMQDDGNFVIYAEGGKPVWATDTYNA